MKINVFYIVVILTMVIVAEGAYILVGDASGEPASATLADNASSSAGTELPAPITPEIESQATITPTPIASSIATSPQASSSDTKAPSVPVGFSATVISDTQINLGWSAASDNIAVAGYRVYRNGIAIGTTLNLKYASIRLSPETSYTFTVRAYDAAGNVSPLSSAVTIATFSKQVATTIPAPQPAPVPEPTPVPPPTPEPTPQPTPEPTPAPTPTTRTVEVARNGTISPAALTIQTGDTVRFKYTNPGDEVILTFSPTPPNNIKLDEEHDTRSYTFTTAGTYTYSKKDDDGINATITVQ